jgi:hypothetical protein
MRLYLTRVALLYVRILVLYLVLRSSDESLGKQLYPTGTVSFAHSPGRLLKLIHVSVVLEESIMLSVTRASGMLPTVSIQYSVILQNTVVLLHNPDTQTCPH